MLKFSQVEKIYKILMDKSLTISFCESASAGALTSLFCELDNISKVFKGSIIAYNNDIKVNVVKVPIHIIEKYGAISKQTAIAMALNTNKILATDICVSITGNSSNINTIEDKPSCLYYVGVALFDKVYDFKVELDVNERNFNRLNIVIEALNILLELLYECDK
ncbi:MAG: CinA family protein [Mycoplasma sp.]